MDRDALVSETPNAKAPSARSNHTVAFVKLVNSYAELYDRWDGLTSNARRKLEEADRYEQDANKVQKELEAVAYSIRDHIIGKAVGDPSPPDMSAA